MQLTIDAAQGQRLKQQGLDQVESDAEFLRKMRWYAQIYSDSQGCVTTDVLRTIAANIRLAPRSPNSWGAIFRGKHWKVIGRQHSALTSNHGRFINVWQYVDDPATHGAGLPDGRGGS